MSAGLAEVMEPIDGALTEVDISAVEAAIETVEEKEVPKYQFDADFQTKIAALLVRDTPFAQRTDGLILPEYFENSIEAAWVSLVNRYFQRYKRTPADKAVLMTLVREDVKSKVINADMAKLMWLHYSETIAKHDISDRDYVIDQVAVFARHQAVTSAIVDAVPLIGRGEFDKVSLKLRKALDTGANADVGTYDYGQNVDIRTVERLERAAGKLPPRGVTTGYPILDDHLYHKGWGKGELAVLMGGAKAGKTTALIEFGRSAVAAGYSVLYSTLEVSDKIIAERLDANISNTKVFDLQETPHEVRDKVRDFMSKGGGRFMIKEFPSGSMRVADLRRLIDAYKSRSIMFDLVIVDYADLMAPERMTENSVENSKNVYVGLRGLAMQENVAVLTATQTNRDGYKAVVAKAEHVAEDFNKIRIADVVISINKTEEERATNQARLYFAASRNQASGFTIRIEQDIERMKFIKKIVGAE